MKVSVLTRLSLFYVVSSLTAVYTRLDVSRKDRIRTCDNSLPKRELYLAELLSVTDVTFGFEPPQRL